MVKNNPLRANTQLQRKVEDRRTWWPAERDSRRWQGCRCCRRTTSTCHWWVPAAASASCCSAWCCLSAWHSPTFSKKRDRCCCFVVCSWSKFKSEFKLFTHFSFGYSLTICCFATSVIFLIVVFGETIPEREREKRCLWCFVFRVFQCIPVYFGACDSNPPKHSSIKLSVHSLRLRKRGRNLFGLSWVLNAQIEGFVQVMVEAPHLPALVQSVVASPVAERRVLPALKYLCRANRKCRENRTELLCVSKALCCFSAETEACATRAVLH